MAFPFPICWLRSLILILGMVGAIFGASLGSWVSDTYGRRSSLRCSSILYLLGVLFIVGADIVQGIVLGRVLVGLALGAASITSPMYIGEESPLNRRGYSIGLFGMLIYVGQLLSKMANSTLSQVFTKLSFKYFLMFIGICRHMVY
jgi:MFS family permease